MGGLFSKEKKDIWSVIYEKGIKDAGKVQKSALKLTVEGKLSGMPSGPVPLHSFLPNQQPANSPPPPREQQLLLSHSHHSPPNSGGGGREGGGHSSHTSASNLSTTSAGAWTLNPAPAITSLEKYTAISTYVDAEWTDRDKKQAKKHAEKLWEQYHHDKIPAPVDHASSSSSSKSKETILKNKNLRPEELHELTRDSLTTLRSHISLFINNQYEEMKKHTQVCMINLLQRFRLTSVGAGGGGSGVVGAGGQQQNPQNLQLQRTLPDSSPAPSGGGSVNPSIAGGSGGSGGAGLGTPTIGVADIDWLNEQVESEKKNMMAQMNAQMEEWIEHYIDISETLWKRMDIHRNGQISEKQFCEQLCPAIYEVVGPHFFNQYMRDANPTAMAGMV